MQIVKIFAHGRQIDGLVQDFSNSIANALELLQSYTTPPRSENRLCLSYKVHITYADGLAMDGVLTQFSLNIPDLAHEGFKCKT